MSTPTQPPAPEPEPLLSETEAMLRARLYQQQRLKSQEDYYLKRIDEFNFNADKMLWVSAALMGISTVVSSLSVADDWVWLAVFTALLPAFASAVSAFRSLYQWERQASIYQATWLALQKAKLAMPDENYLKQGDYAKHFPELVQRAEEVFRREASQWGQMEGVTSDSGIPPVQPPPEPPKRPR